MFEILSPFSATKMKLCLVTNDLIMMMTIVIIQHAANGPTVMDNILRFRSLQATPED